MIIAFYKPFGVLSQFTAPDNHAGAITLASFALPPHVYACGRLDQDSEGLLLLSDDGSLQHRVSDPTHKQPKTYWVQVERVPPALALVRLASGLTLNDGPTRPCEARLLDEEPVLPPREPPIRFRKSVSTAWLEIVLMEGRNRQVRRMTAAVGYPTLRLVRAAIGRVGLSGLAPGRWREIAPSDI